MDVDNPPSSSAADADPIVASYNVYTNPSLPTNRKLVILQHPNKQGPVNNPYAQLSEVRTKKQSGMIEVDVPMSHAHSDYDRDKGLRWGASLAKSVAAKSGGSHGLAGGFGVGVPTVRTGGKRKDDFDRDIDTLSWSEAVRQDKVLRTQTLGGQFPPESETNCRWMVGVFKGDQLHLTPASALIQLRPQLHHLDATTEQDRLSRPREGAAAAGAAGKDAAPSAAGPPARAIHMSIKSAGSGTGEATTETMADRLRSVQLEPWRKLKYEDDESPRSWNMFSNNLIYRGAKAKGDADEKDKGKGKEKETAAGELEASDAQQLKVLWGTEEYLKAVSGMKDGLDGGDAQAGDEVLEVKREEAETAPAEAAKKAPAAKGKAKATPATAAKKPTTAKGKSVAFKGTAMEID
ncbi:Sin-like protein conserved region-domain-containing protein [Xylariomycetidae sp. FL0641]|nr:Sin-like protein conserved region-domain-containing protein [Xylariomycetidae sp. FL0641]